MGNALILFKRRFDSHKFEKTMRKHIGYVAPLSKSFDDFEARLFTLSLVNYFHDKHDIDIRTFNSEDISEISEYLSDIYGGLIKSYYRNAKRR